MDLPVLLPPELNVLEDLKEEEILKFLVNSPSKGILFIGHALRDIGWSFENSTFLKNLIEIYSKKFRQGSFTYYNALALEEKLYSQAEIIEKIISSDIGISVGKKIYQVNSILFATASELFYDYFRFQCLEQRKKTIHLDEKIFDFSMITQYLQKGFIHDLWKLEKDVLFDLLLQASNLKISRFAEQIAEVYYRYLDESCSKQLLKLSIKQQIPELLTICIRYINSYQHSFFLYQAEQRLGFGFKDFSEISEENFNEFVDYICDLSFTKLKIEKDHFYPYLKKIRYLKSLNLSETNLQLSELEELPKTLLEIDLSMCYWLTPDILEKIAENCPNIRNLILKRNTHLNFSFWKIFSLFLELNSLQLARCYQITDEDLKNILKNLSHILKLNIENCHKITDDSIMNLVKKFPFLLTLNLSGTDISDVALVEIGFYCYDLEEIHINKCRNVTELGISKIKKMCKKLKNIEI